MLKDYFKLGLKNLRKRKLRSWLTMFGIFLSIASIFILISLSLGLQKAVEEQFELLGSDKFFVQPAGQLGAPGSTAVAVKLTEKDAEVIKKVKGVKDYVVFTGASAKVEFSGEIRYSLVWGIDVEHQKVYTESQSFKLEEGRKLKESDKNSLILGNNFKNKALFKKPVRAGSKLIINSEEFKVRGILEPIGNPDDDKMILMDIKSFKKLFKTGDRIDWIIVQVEKGENIINVAERVEKKLRKSRDVSEEAQDFAVLTPEELLRSIGNVLGIITSFLLGIAAISLLVGGIGIANTMYTSIIERTKEIGTMKAVGAKNSDILKIFVIESGLLGLIGGVIGVLIGISISKGIEFIAINQLGTTLLKAVMPVWLIIGSLAFAFAAGAVSGVLPALQAAKLKPVDALRYE